MIHARSFCKSIHSYVLKIISCSDILFTVFDKPSLLFLISCHLQDRVQISHHICSFSASDMASAIKFLATRMEEMENSFLSIFFEAASKVAESTESKLFFMMESSDGVRKIGGNRELKKLFQLKRLLPQKTDVTLGEDKVLETDDSVEFTSKIRKRKNDVESDEVVKKRQKIFAQLRQTDSQVKEEEVAGGSDHDYEEEEENNEDMSQEADCDEDRADGNFKWVGDYVGELSCEVTPMAGKTEG